MSAENLRYLSLDQAIADVAYFIEYVKENIPGLQNSKVILMIFNNAALIIIF